MKCLSCGNDLPADSTFCNQCGAPQTISCKSCGQCNPPGSRFCGKCGIKLADAVIATSATDQPLAAAQAATRLAERRHVTVMFCDLVGSTALAGRLDPEDLSEVISAYQKCVAAVVCRFGGFIAKYMGDGVLVYFGYPEAHEDDAERAVRSALTLVDSIGHLDTLAGTLQIRIGVATGLVVVGDLVGQGEAQERGIVGETPNLAARLQALARPNDIVICPNTRRLVGDLFEYETLGAVELKGFSEPVSALRVVRESTVESRFEALHARQTPIVGREEELEMLLRRWRGAKAGEGRVVLISGEPGIGKSRLTAALQEHLKGELHFGVRYFCSPHHQGSALQPVIVQLKAAAGFSREDTPETQIAKLEALLARTTDDVATTAGSFAALLGIPAGDPYPLSHDDPQRRREQLLAALLAQLDGMARRQPVVVTFEDAQWADPTTLELLTLINERVPSRAILVIITFRPEFQSPFVGQPHVTMLALNRLGRRERVAMVEQVTGGKALPPGLLDQIIERTDGVPLFVEEITMALLESTQLRETADQYVLDVPFAPLSIPTSLQASLMARLDRLGSAKEVVQVGAAIGREFSYELLAAVADLPDAGLRVSLAQLTGAELVFQRGTPPNAIFTFKHALVQDAAYSTMLRAKRQQLHGRIAQSLEKHFPDLVSLTPEVVAQHFEKARQHQQAIRYWRQAGDRALRNSNLKEALAHLSNALRLVETDPESDQRDEQELAICLQLGLATQMAYGPTSKEARDYYQRAEKIARDKPARGRERFIATWGLWFFLLQTTQFKAAIARAGELLTIARDMGDPDLVLEAYHASLPGLFVAGQYPALKDAAQEVMRRYDRQRHGDHANMFGGHDSRVCARSYYSFSLWAFGFFDQASQEAHATIADARTLGHQFSLAHGLLQSGFTFLLLHDKDMCAAIASELVPIAEKNKFPWPLTYGQFLTGWVLSQRGDHEAGVKQMIVAANQPNARNRQPFMLTLVAEVEAYAGRDAAALELLGQARQVSIDTGLRFYDAEIARLRGDILLRLSRANEAEAEACFADAITIARQQSCRALELRTITSLARLRRDQNRGKEARELLAPVYDWFPKGLDLPDLTAAKVLLAELV